MNVTCTQMQFVTGIQPLLEKNPRKQVTRWLSKGRSSGYLCWGGGFADPESVPDLGVHAGDDGDALADVALQQLVVVYLADRVQAAQVRAHLVRRLICASRVPKGMEQKHTQENTR